MKLFSVVLGVKIVFDYLVYQGRIVSFGGRFFVKFSRRILYFDYRYPKYHILNNNIIDIEKYYFTLQTVTTNISYFTKKILTKQKVQ